MTADPPPVGHVPEESTHLAEAPPTERWGDCPLRPTPRTAAKIKEKEID